MMGSKSENSNGSLPEVFHFQSLEDFEKRIDANLVRLHYEREDARLASIEEETRNTKIAKLRATSEKHKSKAEALRASIHNTRQNIQLRKDFSNKAFLLMCGWLTLILAMVFLDGFELAHFRTEVLITLFSTSTLSVVGIFMVIARYIFPPNVPPPEPG